MEWQIELAKLESQKDWFNALNLLEKVISEEHSNVGAYIYMVYLLNDVALEERDLKLPLTFDHLVDLVKEYYYKSSSIFSDNAQYCFFYW